MYEKRLTARMNDGTAFVVSETGKEGTGYFTTKRRIPEIIAKLAYLEDLIENGELVKVAPKIDITPKYTPVCPRGYTDCVCDPAYIKHHHPEWYEELYGDKTPEEALNVENGCMERFKDDPNEEYYCYDDEDK